MLLSISFADAQMLALRRRLCFFNNIKRAWTHSWPVPDHLQTQIRKQQTRPPSCEPWHASITMTPSLHLLQEPGTHFVLSL